jgi:uncharacterized protein (TIGR03437 family)
MEFQQLTAIVILSTGILTAQSAPASLGDSYVNGKYYFRHLQYTTDASGNLADIRSALGIMTFDGAGHYSLNAQQTVGIQAVTPLTGSGGYSIGAGGTMTIGNPQRNSLTINARVGPEAIIGSTTESGDNTFDLFIAIPAPTSGPSFSGSFYTSTLEFPGASVAAVRSTFSILQPASSGLFSNINVAGHARNVNAGAVSNITLTGASFSLQADGSGTADFGVANNLLSGTKNIYVSLSGNVILGGSIITGSHDLLVGVKQFSGTASLKNLTGLYFTCGLRYDGAHATSAGYAGSLSGAPSLAKVTYGQREHQIGMTAAYDYTGVNDISLNSDGSYAEQFNFLGLGANGNSFVDTSLSQFDQSGYSIDFGVRAPALAGTGVYIHPQGILNGGSFAPSSVSPGEFVTIYGSGLAGAEAAAAPPFPTSLGGITVMVNNVAAPIALISPNQLNVLIPYGITGTAATFVVTNNGAVSNSVAAPISKTSPGVFSLDSTGTGAGAILHADYSAVNASSPAKRGETVQIYLSGLGAVNQPVGDGVIPGTNPVAATVTVFINGQSAKLAYAGLTPGSPGLYQINATVPANLVGTGALPLAIQTADAFHDMVDIQVQ